MREPMALIHFGEAWGGRAVRAEAGKMIRSSSLVRFSPRGRRREPHRAGRRFVSPCCPMSRYATVCGEFTTVFLPTRLETRTKESNTCASRWALSKPAGTSESEGSASLLVSS